MERLTYRDDEGRAQWTHALLEDDSGMAGPLIRDRLAAYEDTGLEPGDVKLAFDEYLMRVLFEDWKENRQFITTDRLRELAQADREKRIIVIPKDNNELLEKLKDLFFSDWAALEGMKNG